MNPPHFISIFFLSISLLGLCLVVGFALNPPKPQEASSWRKPLTGLTFSLICFLGIIASSYPSKCFYILHFKKNNHKHPYEDRLGPQEKAPTLKGHHPNCGKFSTHVYHIGNKTLCVGCTGLALGAILSLLGAALYFFGDLNLQQEASSLLLLGSTGVIYGLLQYHLPGIKRSFTHLTINIYFIFSMLLILVSVDTITLNMAVNLYSIALSILWLYTRIILSQLNHRRICHACNVEECEFHLKGGGLHS